MKLSLVSAVLALLLVTHSASAADPLPVQEERAMKSAVARVAPSVVRIETVGGLERIGQVLVGTGPTTGLVVSEDGYVISSAYNFAQKPDSILVSLGDGNRLPARLVATDHNRMLVLLKVDAGQKLPVPEAVPAAEMRVGQWALAVGRTFDGGVPSVSIGIVSALNRIWGKAIQTDAKISPTNYGGPLVDISGRVLGVLVPLTPDATGDVAGVEWYDSGIGFAVSLDHINKVLPRLKSGQDLKSGLLGISLERGDQFSKPARIAACRGGSPAFKAGIRAGDTIVEIEGHQVVRQTELKQQLNNRYAGDTIKVVVLRGKERLEHAIELTDKLAPYELPFLGILPKRSVTGESTKLVVRYVYPGSPAAKAGVEIGDEIKTVAGEKVKDAAEATAQVAALAPGEKIKLEIARSDKTLTLEPELARAPEDLPDQLPPAHDEPAATEGDKPETGVVAIKAPEFANECFAFVPENYNPQVPYGVVVWLHAPGGFNQAELVGRWRKLCVDHDLILLAPKAADATKWQPTEVAFIRRALDDVIKKYNVDRSRIVTHGHEGGGAIAFMVTLSSRGLVKAAAVVDAPLPMLVPVPETDPTTHLAFYITTAAKSSSAAQIEASIAKLRSLKHPVTVKNLDAGGGVQKLNVEARYLNDAELEELVRWIDTLDRI